MPDRADAARAAHSIVVVGASAAGLYTASRLAERGYAVTLLEAANMIAPPRRSLIVTPDFLDYAEAEAVVAETDRFELVAGSRMAHVPLARPDLIIERARLVRSLLARARRAGVEILTGHRFSDFAPSATLAVVSSTADGRTRTIPAGHVVAADGAVSRVARAAGWQRRPCAPLIQAIVPWPDDVAPTTTRVYFEPDDTPYFYWLIPDGPSRGALGVIGEDGAATRRRFQRFLERVGFAPLEYQGARIPIYTGWDRVSRRMNSGHVHLVGDAAGHVKVSTVGGIVTGLKGADAVVHAIAGGDVRAFWRARVELDTHLLIRRALHRFTVEDYASLIDGLNGAAVETLGAITRDHAARLLVRLLVAQPRLALLGLRGGLAPGRHFGAAHVSAAFRRDVGTSAVPPS